VDWVKQHRQLSVFALIVALQVVMVVAIVVREEGLQRGTEIVLESQPVDPRDPIRGDFVILGYRAEDIENTGGPRPSEGDWVYVTFEDRGRYWEPTVVLTRILPASEWNDERVSIRARVVSESPLRVEYPDLGEYFVPQGTGMLPEPPDVHVSVSEDGTARILYLEIDGKRWPFDEAER
jgi:uncharacterized membrane-anchored protein